MHVTNNKMGVGLFDVIQRDFDANVTVPVQNKTEFRLLCWLYYPHDNWYEKLPTE